MLKRRPTQEEFAPYYGGYINKVEGDDIISNQTHSCVLTAPSGESVREVLTV